MKLINTLLHHRLALLALLVSPGIFAQTGSIQGRVKVDNEPIEFTTVVLIGTSLGSTTDAQGRFQFEEVPFGTYEIKAFYLGYENQIKTVTLSQETPTITADFILDKRLFKLDEIVVTGTKTFKRQTNSAVIVNVLSGKTLDNVQACNLSEGLKFQPGLRVESNCQTCNYTQLRMNGLAGGYAQILVNGRPIFSPLTGLYGLEQLPVNMIERIEVVRGGGSSLYGSSAIGGTVNVITKIPQKDAYELGYTYQNTNGQASDKILSGNATVLSGQENSGISFFLNHRERDFYDHNGDNFSELPLLNNTSIGVNYFLLPREQQKLEFSLSQLNEYRLGGEMADGPVHLTQQAEERTHRVWMGSLDYQINFNDENSSLITYLAWQNTQREHYTGILPDDSTALQQHWENPPYGTSLATTVQGGLQWNQRLQQFLGGTNVITLGAEYLVDDVFDKISAYQYVVDQTTKDLGVFFQSDWEITPTLNLLAGVRMDDHNLVDRLVLSPRAALLYKYRGNTQFRLSYGTGFRAPQAFDTDLHIAFAGGGVSRVTLSPTLLPEQSSSLSGSINYDKATERFIAGFTLEFFATRLNDAFYLQPLGEDSFGERFEKRNGQGATVKGGLLELRANYAGLVQLETGLTLQSSRFDEAVQYIETLEGIQDFIRTPQEYGFATLSVRSSERINTNLSYTYTGSMLIPHFGGAPNQPFDEMVVTRPFSELNLKIDYSFSFPKLESQLVFFGGVKNLFNAYQQEFDVGKNRDSNFIYGPSFPRTFFIGLKMRS
jgi:outer membrane receptor for ferrienterochelin and colicins